MRFKVTHLWGAKWNGRKFVGGKKRVKIVKGKNWASAVKRERFGVISKVKDMK